jgi:antitoxin ParD1/3/4
MATMNISLPDPLRDWVQEQIQDGNYASSSDYVRDLIRRDRESREHQMVLQEAITAGLKSGISQRSLEELLEEAKAKFAALNAH